MKETRIKFIIPDYVAYDIMAMLKGMMRTTYKILFGSSECYDNSIQKHKFFSTLGTKPKML